MSTDRLYLIHILECIERIEQYTASGYRSFQRTKMIQDAVLRNLHTLTESTQQLSEAAKDAHPEMDWQGISRFRNVVVHDYLGNSNSAIDSLEQAVALAPHDFIKRRKLGRQLLKHQQYARAQHHLRWCADQMPSDRSLRRDLQTCLHAGSTTLRR